MNVTKKTKVTYSLTDLTEQQAQDLLNISAVHEDTYNESETETLDNLRQSLLSAGLVRSEGVE